MPNHFFGFLPGVTINTKIFVGAFCAGHTCSGSKIKSHHFKCKFSEVWRRRFSSLLRLQGRERSQNNSSSPNRSTKKLCASFVCLLESFDVFCFLEVLCLNICRRQSVVVRHLIPSRRRSCELENPWCQRNAHAVHVCHRLMVENLTMISRKFVEVAAIWLSLELDDACGDSVCTRYLTSFHASVAGWLLWLENNPSAPPMSAQVPPCQNCWSCTGRQSALNKNECLLSLDSVNRVNLLFSWLI